MRRAAAPPTGINPGFLALLQAEPLAELAVLDVGTGWGRLGLELTPHSRRVVGIDREPSLIEEARRRRGRRL